MKAAPPERRIARGSMFAVCVGLFASWLAAARADEASGRWTGRAELRSSSFRERNTSILAPTLGVRLDSARRTTLRANYLIDAISSASVSVDVVTGASVTVDPTQGGHFRERRQEGSVGVEQSLSVGENDLVLGASARTSHERDYHSYSGTLSGALALDERNLLLGLAVTYLRDEVRYVEHGTDAMGRTTTSVRPLPGRSDFDGLVVSASVERVLGPRAALTVGYDLGFMSGYLGNPYRLVQVDARIARESVPTTRLRHAPWTLLRVAFPSARSALHLVVRGYSDDWAVRAFTGEVRYYQELGPYLMLRVRYRGYAQTAAFFDSGSSALIPTFPDYSLYTTSNPRYAAMNSHEPGLAFVTRLSFLGGERAPRMADTELEFSFDYRVASNRFGNALFGAFVLRMPIP